MQSPMKLTDPSLEAALTKTPFGKDLKCNTLVFKCPVCGDHTHLIPFLFGIYRDGKFSNGMHRWGHTDGTTLKDITLSPSYEGQTSRLVEGRPMMCKLHVYVSEGELVILDDSGLIEP